MNIFDTEKHTINLFEIESKIKTSKNNGLLLSKDNVEDNLSLLLSNAERFINVQITYPEMQSFAQSSIGCKIIDTYATEMIDKEALEFCLEKITKQKDKKHITEIFHQIKVILKYTLMYGGGVIHYDNETKLIKVYPRVDIVPLRWKLPFTALNSETNSMDLKKDPSEQKESVKVMMFSTYFKGKGSDSEEAKVFSRMYDILPLFSPIDFFYWGKRLMFNGMVVPFFITSENIATRTNHHGFSTTLYERNYASLLLYNLLNAYFRVNLKNTNIVSLKLQAEFLGGIKSYNECGGIQDNNDFSPSDFSAGLNSDSDDSLNAPIVTTPIEGQVRIENLNYEHLLHMEEQNYKNLYSDLGFKSVDVLRASLQGKQEVTQTNALEDTRIKSLREDIFYPLLDYICYVYCDIKNITEEYVSPENKQEKIGVVSKLVNKVILPLSGNYSLSTKGIAGLLDNVTKFSFKEKKVTKEGSSKNDTNK